MTKVESPTISHAEVFVGVPLESSSSSSSSNKMNETAETETVSTPTEHPNQNTKDTDHYPHKWLLLKINLGFLLFVLVQYSYMSLRTRTVRSFLQATMEAPLVVTMIEVMEAKEHTSLEANKEDIQMDHHHVEQQQHATVLTSDSFEPFLKDHRMVYVNFCMKSNGQCQTLHSKWQALARRIQEQGIQTAVGEVNCDIHSDLCFPQQSRFANPTVAWFENGVRQVTCSWQQQQQQLRPTLGEFCCEEIWNDKTFRGNRTMFAEQQPNKAIHIWNFGKRRPQRETCFAIWNEQ